MPYEFKRFLDTLQLNLRPRICISVWTTGDFLINRRRHILWGYNKKQFLIVIFQMGFCTIDLITLPAQFACKAVCFFFWASCWNHCLAALDLGAGVEQPLNCLIAQNRQAVQSVGRSIDWTLEDNMVEGLFFCATLTDRRGDHAPFVQAGAETSDTGAEAVKPDRGSSWEGHSGGVPVSVINMRSLVGLSVHSAFHW